jgi:hypothetical protein
MRNNEQQHRWVVRDRYGEVRTRPYNHREHAVEQLHHLGVRGWVDVVTL